MLFMTLDARRKHAVSTICVDNIVFKDDKVILLPSKTLKHSKSTTPLQPLIYNAYKKNISFKCLSLKETNVSKQRYNLFCQQMNVSSLLHFAVHFCLRLNDLKVNVKT